MSEWQPIETAPRDGSVIDLWVVETLTDDLNPSRNNTKAYRIANAWWGQPYGDYFKPFTSPKPPMQWCKDGDAYGEHWVDLVEEDRVWGRAREVHSVVIATHWMPLPPPPASSGAHNGGSDAGLD